VIKTQYFILRRSQNGGKQNWQMRFPEERQKRSEQEGT